MTTTVANQQPRINLANGGSTQSAQVVTLKSGQQNASSVDSKSPMHSFELRTSSTLPRCSRVTSNPEVEPQKRDGQNLASGTRGIYEMGCSPRCPFQGTAIANSDAKTQSWHSDRIVRIHSRVV